MRRFLKDRSGVVSVEFAMIAPFFFALLFSFFETGWLVTKDVMLNNSVSHAARMVYTGRAPTKDALEEMICAKNPLIDNCRLNINIEMQVINSFGDQPDTQADCIDSEAEDLAPAVNYNASAGAEIVFMRVCMTTDVLVPGLGVGLGLDEDGTGRYSIVASTAFMNEPF